MCGLCDFSNGMYLSAMENAGINSTQVSILFTTVECWDLWVVFLYQLKLSLLLNSHFHGLGGVEGKDEGIIFPDLNACSLPKVWLLLSSLCG